MAEDTLSNIDIGEFETLTSLLVSNESLQVALVILFAGLAAISGFYVLFSRWVRQKKFYYIRPHFSRFVMKAVLPLFAIALVTSVNSYVQIFELFEDGKTGTTKTQETFAKLLNSVNILVVGYTVSQIIPIMLIKREKSSLEKHDYDEWVSMKGFQDDPCGNCDVCSGKKYGTCENQPDLFHRLFKWDPPKESPETIEEKEFDEYLKTKEGLQYLENYYDNDGNPLGSYESLVKNPYESWKKSERQKYHRYFDFCISGNNQSGQKLKLGKYENGVLPIDEWREEKRLKKYGYVVPGGRHSSKLKAQLKSPSPVRQILPLVIFGATILGIIAWWGVDLLLLATATGGFAIGLGLALQETMQNYFAYILIRKDKIFEEGDRVSLENGPSGDVYRITPRVTYIKSPLSESLVIVPTRHMINSVIKNFTKEVKMVPAMVDVGVSYLNNAKQVSAILVKVGKRAMKEVIDRRGAHLVIQNRCPYLDENKPSCGCDKHLQGDVEQPIVRFRKYNDSSLDFSVWVYAQNFGSKFKIESDMRTIIQEEFAKYDIRIPWPIRTVYHGDSDKEGKEISKLDKERDQVLEEYGKGDASYGGIEDE